MSATSTIPAALLALALFVPVAAQDPRPAPAAPAEAPPRPAESEGAADPEARLLEGELLELAEGKLDEAVELYRALLAREDLVPELRARTLFSLARAHRKRGELGAAKERAEELAALPGAPAELVDAARRTLEDLEAGAARLPPFDWVAEVEKNPEIQAQIFAWGMQLVGGSSEEATNQWREAKRKLLALGVTVVPTLEGMLERSASPYHRAHLADVLVNLGVFRHIPHLIDQREFTDALQNLSLEPAEVRADAASYLASLDGDRNRQRFAARWRLELGSIERLDEDIRILLEPTTDRARAPWLPLHFGLHPENTIAYRDRLVLIAEISFQHYEAALQGLLLASPELVRREDLEPLRVPRQSYTGFWIEPLSAHRLDDFLWLLEGPSAPQLLIPLRDLMRATGSQLTRASWEERLAGLPIHTRARLLRATQAHSELLELALSEAVAVPEFASFLAEASMPLMENADPAAPDLRFATAPFRLDTNRTSRGRPIAADPSGAYPPPRQVPLHLEEAMEQVFRASTEQWRRAIALELIVRAYPNARRESFELLRTILADPAADPLERVAAMTGILIRLPDHEPERDSILRLVEEYAAQVGEADWLPSVGTPVDGGLFDVRIGSMANRTSGHWMLPGQLIVDYLRTLDSTWKSRTHVERLALGLLPSIIQGRGIDLYRRIQFYLQNGSRHEMDQQIAAFDIPLARWAEETEDAERLRALAEPLLGVSHRVYPLPTRAWKRILGDPLVDATLRGRFLQSLNPQMNAPIPLAAIFDELDWSALLLADDPLADHIVRTKFWQPIEEHRLAARASPRIEVQRWAWEVAPLPETPEELEPLIGSDDLRLREIGYGLALTAEDTRWLPVLHRAAREGPPSSREPAIDRLAFFADESSLPVLTALLDDPVFSVRAKALEALETIESVLEKQEKWRERFGEKKKD